MRSVESNIQINCVKWFRNLSPWRLDEDVQRMFFSVPNGGKRSAVTASIMKAEGVMAGVSDLLLLVPRNGYNGLCIEMKTLDKKSHQSDHQKDWQRSAEKMGYKYVVCRCLDGFIEEVSDYLKTDPGNKL